MKRIIDYYLSAWKNKGEGRKPLILRGARQVGKTHSVRKLGKTFTHFVEVNLESNEKARKIFEQDLDVKRIVFELALETKTKIVPGKTLLFIDEIQLTPKAIIALRYFYELMPELHVIAAGSLLDFAIEQVGVPVGRVTMRYMYPLSFFEFLIALGHEQWVTAILEGPYEINEGMHDKLLSLLGNYLAIGGMPAAVNEWINTQNPQAVKEVHADLIYSYQEDFDKYAQKHQIKYLNLLFLKAIQQLSNKFMFSRVGEYQKRELAPALELLEKAGLFYPVIRSAGQGIPIGAQADLDHFKIIFLDVGLCQALLNLDLTSWFLEPKATFINKGEIVEAFIGQELLAYSDRIRKESLYYWQREIRGSHAEIDYLIQLKDKVVPIEVKAGNNKRIISMHIFLDSHPNSSFGIRFWAGKLENDERIKSYPLYSVAKVMIEQNEELGKALKSMLL